MGLSPKEQEGLITGGAYNRRGLKAAFSVVCYATEVKKYSASKPFPFVFKCLLMPMLYVS